MIEFVSCLFRLLRQQHLQRMCRLRLQQQLRRLASRRMCRLRLHQHLPFQVLLHLFPSMCAPARVPLNLLYARMVHSQEVNVISWAKKVLVEINSFLVLAIGRQLALRVLLQPLLRLPLHLPPA